MRRSCNGPHMTLRVQGLHRVILFLGHSHKRRRRNRCFLPFWLSSKCFFFVIARASCDSTKNCLLTKVLGDTSLREDREVDTENSPTPNIAGLAFLELSGQYWGKVIFSLHFLIFSRQSMSPSTMVESQLC
jgi:hypothetical protein